MSQSFAVDETWSVRCCPACSASKTKLLFLKENVPFVECTVCQTVYINPLHLKIYLRQLYQNLGADYFTDQAKLALDFDPNRYWREISIIPKQLRQGRLLM